MLWLGDPVGSYPSIPTQPLHSPSLNPHFLSHFSKLRLDPQKHHSSRLPQARMYDNPLSLRPFDDEKTAVKVGAFTSFCRKSRSRSAKVRSRRKRNESSLMSVIALERYQQVEVQVCREEPFYSRRKRKVSFAIS